jgi:hypothetical protein
MLRKVIFQWITPLVILITVISSCTGDDAKDRSTLFNVRMTDDPIANVQQVNVDLKTIIVTTDTGKDSFELGTNAGIYNLLDYQGDLDTLIGTTTTEALFIHQIRLVLGDNNTIMVDSVLHELKTPSAQQSGLKINVQKDLNDLDVYNLLIDFDAEESVVEQGNGNYLLKPVIRVVE